MERMWRKVNQGLSSRSSLSKSAVASTTNAAVATDTASSAGFGDPQVVVAVVGSSSNVSGNIAIASNTTTGRRLASSGQQHSSLQHRNTSFSQHVISTASSDRRRKRRRKSRPRRNGERSVTGYKNDQLFQPSATCSLGVPSTVGKPQFQNQSVTNTSTLASVGNIPGPSNFAASSTGTTSAGTMAIASSTTNNVANTGSSSGTGDPSLRQRAVAKLRLFNFHLNWDLHMTQCKPCGPRSSGNILTRRLCRNRRREDNELYRSNSFKFERFERKEFSEAGTDTLQKQISVCDDYSLPIDFVKKRPSSFDPCLAETIKDSWIAPSPSSDHVKFLDQPAILAHSANVVKLVEAYSDPKDSKKLNKSHRKNRNKEKKSTNNSVSGKTAYNSADSSAPKSSADDENQSIKVPELNSPDSISEDLVRPLQTHKSPKRVTGPDTSKRNPSPYYYSDLLKSKEDSKEPKLRARQSTVSEPLPLLQSQPHILAYKKSSSLDVPDIEREVHPPKRYSITEDGVRIIRCDSPSTTTSDDSDCSECRKRREWHVKALALVRETCNISVTSQPESNLKENNIDSTQNHTSMPPHRLLGPAVCACAAPALGDDIDEFFRPRSIFYVHQQGIHECIDCSTTIGSDKSTNTGLHEDEMSSGRTRKIYETAFDCKISRSDDDLDEVDRFNSHSVLLQINNGNSGAATSNAAIGTATTTTTPGKVERPKSNKSRIEVKRMKNSKSQISQDSSTNISTLSHELENVHIDSNLDNVNNANTTSISQLPIRGYTPSPPSTAPLPVKFPGKHDRYFMNSIKSAPNLPSSNPAHPRLKDLRLPGQTVRHQHEVPAGKDGCILDTTYNSQRTHERPRSIVLESGRVLELRKSHHGNHQRGRNFSSTESMATSSSGGSMESLRSSTSEGNRSTTSSESRHSTSLSSHSSDSGHSVAFPLRAPVVLHSKLHILSPISDKSSQEPASETSDVNNKNNNSQKVSPDENTKPIFDHSEDLPTDVQKQPKRRTLPNKAILHLTDEILGSDSGISLHSREDGKPQNVFHKFALPNINIPSEKESANVGSSGGLPQDLRDLPFDMPKLRRRKQTLQQDPFTSGSATSVDLGDLPFDMPKLRRRLRMNQPQVSNILIHSTESSGISQASSSHSVRDENKQTTTDSAIFRQNLTLNLGDSKPPNKFGSLDLKASSSRGLNLNLGNSGLPMAVDIIDISLPLERQGWYHGAITRIDAESTLRQLNEGSFLVRNCESTKQDYSLSLKSAKGFMHMRIQRNDAGRYILGQFSRPFESIPEMIRHFCLNRLPVRGAEHMCLLEPVIAQLL